MSDFTKRFIAVLFICIMPSLLYAQNTGNEQRLVGTWIDDENNTWTFSANGTLSILTAGGEAISGRYGAAGPKVVMITDEDKVIGDFYISADGRTLIIEIDDDVALFIKKT